MDIQSFINIYFNRVIYRGQAFYNIQLYFLCFIILHSVYICIAKLFFVKSLFIEVRAPFGLFYGPFFYIGLTSLLLKDKTKVFKKQWMHFLLGLIFFAVFIFIFFFFRDDYEVLKVYSIVMYGLICIQMILYTFFAYIKFSMVVKDKRSIEMMSQSIIVMLATVLIFVAFAFSDLKEESNILNSFIIYSLMLSAVIIMFRYNLLVLMRKFNYYKKNYTGKMFFDFFKEEFSDTNTDKPDDQDEVTDESGEENNKYQKSRISEEEMKTYLKRLNRALEDKIYLNPDLTLELLSKTMHIPKYRLTQVFNLGLSTNFNKYINALRIQHAVHLLDDPDSQITIEEIMRQSGFNSRSSFYRAFHVHYDISPVDYRKQSNS